MKNFVLLFLVACSTLTYGQKYKTGGSNQAYRIIDSDTIFANKTLYENIKAIPKFSYAAKIMELTGAQATLDKQGMCTVFLPTNAAFSNYNEDELKVLISPANATQLKQAFMSHIISGRVDANSIVRMTTANKGSAIFRSPGEVDPEATVKGNVVTLSVPSGATAKITDTNYFHAQGYLHIVDGFLYTESND